ncbi:16S RNA G1207 methylase RsmC [Kocuria dechangensis]|uniref:16S RNA G1207 methylase RsmC n=1 Tax=Kocuria dechangensis TaxID=1176249 RepID=A0A917GH29_9MICC|nr:methyltransferase [Kocuria dechangensis]GGG44804.1 16S RNA G1207 methylase RsmC [Kocuria dechangensis]
MAPRSDSPDPVVGPATPNPGTEHYFSEDPATPELRRPVTVALRGREVVLQTSNGVFSPRGLDKGTSVLLENVPDPQGGELLDVGCGWGPIALSMAAAAPGSRVTAVDVNERSLRLTRDNAAALGLDNVVALLPGQVPAERRFDTIWSNPPIRIGKQQLHELLLLWLPRLAPGGTAWLVVQKNLGADSLQKWLASALGGDCAVSRHSTDRGFRVLRVERRA